MAPPVLSHDKVRGPGRFLLVVWLAIFVANFMAHRSRGPGTGADTFKYLTPILNWIRGRGYTYLGEPALTFPPGYGLRTLPLYLFGVDLIQAAVITNALFLAMSCLFIYLICRFYVSKVMAILAMLFIVTNAYIMWFATLAMSEVTFMALITGAGYFLLKFIRQPRRNVLNLVVAGVFVGCAALTRPEGVGVALMLALFLVVDLVLRRPPPRIQLRFVARLAGYAVIFMAPFVILYSPYVAYLSKNTGHFTMSGKYEMDIMQGNSRIIGNFDIFRYDMRNKIAREEGIKSTFPEDVRRVKVNLVRYVEFGIIENVASISALILILALRVRRGGFRWSSTSLHCDSDTFEAFSFCAFMLAPILPMSFFLSEERMFIPYSAFVIIAMAVAMDRIISHPPAEARGGVDPRLYALAVAAPLLIVGAATNGKMWLNMSPDRQLQKAGFELALLAPERPINLMALRRGEVTSYYANGSRVRPDANYVNVAPDLGPEGLAATMRANGLDYLVVDRFYIHTRPALSPLWTCAPSACPGGVRLVAEAPNRYRIFKAPPESGLDGGA